MSSKRPTLHLAQTDTQYSRMGLILDTTIAYYIAYNLLFIYVLLGEKIFFARNLHKDQIREYNVSHMCTVAARSMRAERCCLVYRKFPGKIYKQRDNLFPEEAKRRIFAVSKLSKLGIVKQTDERA